MALIIGGVDVASLKVTDFPQGEERDAFVLGILHGLDAAASFLRDADPQDAAHVYAADKLDELARARFDVEKPALPKGAA